MEKKFNINQYVKNVTRSIGYVSMKTVKNLNPVIADYADSNMDTIKEMYEAASKINIKNMLSKERIADNEYAKIAKDTVSNFFDDLKTGNFYNSGRTSAADDAASVEMFGDVDFDDFDFGDFDDLDDDDDSSDDGMNIDNIDKIGEKIANSTGAAVMKSADYTVRANHASMKMLMASNERAMGSLNTSIVGVGSTVASIGKTLIESSAKFYENSFKFYEMMTEQMAKQTGYLENMHKMIESRYNSNNKKTKSSKNAYKNILDINNLPNLSSYFKHIKSNVSDATMGLSDMLMMAKDSSGDDGGVSLLRAMLASPVSSLMIMGSTSLGKKAFGDVENGTGSLGRMNKMLKGLFPTALAKLGKMKDDGIQGFIKRLLNVQPETKTKADSSKYEKGPLQWTGKDSKALQEVIPTILNKILAAITNETPSIFDYDRGRWVNSKDLRKNLHREVRSKARSNIDSDLSKSLNEYLVKDLNEENISENSKKKKVNSFNEDMVNLYQYLSMNTSKIPLNDKQWKELENDINGQGLFIKRTGDSGIMLYSNFLKIKKYFSLIRSDRGKGGKNIQLSSFAGDIYNTSNSISSIYKDIEESGNTYNYLFNESEIDKLKPMKTNLLSLYVDDNGNNIFHYLREIADNTSNLISSNRQSRRRRGKNGKTITDTSRGGNRGNISKPKHIGFIGPMPKVKSSSYDDMKEFYDHDVDYDYFTDQQLKDMDKSKEREKQMKDALDDTLNKISITKKFKFLGDAIFNTLSKPIESANKMIDKTTDNIYYLFFGDSKNDGLSLSDRLKNGFEKTFESIKNTLKEKLSPIGKAIKDSLLNMMGFEDTNQLKEAARGKISKVQNKFKEFGSWAMSAASMPINAIGSMINNRRIAAKGGQVKKTGMIAVSEGEIIIPSEYNPNYKKPTNKTQQVINENRALSKWLRNGGNISDYRGSFAEGGVVEEKNDAYNNMYNDTKSIINETKDAIVDSTKNVLNRLFGDLGNEKDVSSKFMKDIQEQVSISYPEMIVGGSIGALAFTAGGLIGGPLVGAALGAAVGLTKNSEKIQRMLFGGTETDDDGNETYKNGLLPKEIVDYTKENLPNLAKGGFLGAVAGSAGLLGPFGLVGGLALGAGLTAASKSDKLQNYLFGDEGILGTNTDKKIKASLPKIGLGALAMAATGPFGLAGNILLGSALGFATETDGFKRFFFGTEDSNGKMQGGLLGLIREEIIDPLKDTMDKIFKGTSDYIKKYISDPIKDFMKPFTNFLGGLIRKPFDWAKNIKDVLSEQLDRTFGGLFNRFGERVIRGGIRIVRGGLGKIGEGVVGAGKIFGKTLNKASDSLTRHNLKAGRTSGMSDEERAEFYENNPEFVNANFRNKNIQFDRKFTRASSKLTNEEVNSSLSDLDNYRNMRMDSAKAKKQIKQDIFNRILADSRWRTNVVFSKDDKVIKALNKAKDTGDFSKVIELMKKIQANPKYAIPQDQFDKLLTFISDKTLEYKEVEGPEYAEKMRRKAIAAAKKIGITVDDYDNDKFRQNVKATASYRNADEAKKDKKLASGDDKKSPSELLPKDATPFERLSLDENNKTNNLIETTNTLLTTQNEKSNELFIESNMLLAKIAGVDPKNKSSSTTTGSSDTKEESIIDKVEEKIDGMVGPKNELAVIDQETKVDFTDYGPIRYIKQLNGWEPDIRDAATKNALSAIKANQNNLVAIKDSLLGFGGFGKFINGLFGKTEDKKKDNSILDTLLSFGDEALEILMKKFLPSLIPTVGGGILAFLAAGLSTLGISELLERMMPEKHRENPEDTNVFLSGFEALENALLGIEPGTYEEGEYRQDSTADRVVSQGLIENSLIKGQPINLKVKPKSLWGKVAAGPLNFVSDLSNGLVNARNFVVNPQKRVETITEVGKKVIEAPNNKWIQKAAKLLPEGGVKTFLTDQASRVRTVADVANKVFHGADKLTAPVTDAVQKASTKVDDLVINNMDKIKNAVSGFFTTAAKFFGVNNSDEIVEFAAKSADEIGVALVKYGPKAGAKNVTKLASWLGGPLGLVVNGVFIGLALQNGWEDAKSILGMLEVNIIERAIAAQINGLNEAIPGIGGIIPSEYLISIYLGYIALVQKLGSFVLKGLKIPGLEYIQNKRAEAQAVVDQYNAENGKTYTVREYIKNVLGEYTTQEKVGKFAGATIKPIWDTGVSNIKNIGSTVFDIGKNGFDTAVGAVSSLAKGDFAGAAKTVASYGINNAKIIADGVLNNQFLPGMSAKIIGDKIGETDAWKGMTDALDKVFKDGSGLFDEGIGGALEKLTAGAGLVFEGVGATASEMIAGAAKSAAGWLSQATGGAVDPFIQGAENLIESTKETAGNIWKDIKGLFGGSSGVHTSQLDAEYMNQRMGNGKVGKNGCGPAVASSVLKRYGKNGNLNSTLAFANRGYTGGSSGTSANYFGDIFSANGINTTYTNNSSNINKSLKNGQPTVLLGQDRNNKSKRNSPFGPKPHYVVAQGKDSKGNIIVDDPELGTTALYNKNILNSTKLGMITGGASEVVDGGTSSSLEIARNSALQFGAIAENAKASSSDYIGLHVKEFESGTQGSAMISSGKGDHGGVSFGTYQFPSYKETFTSEGNLPVFWNKYYASRYPGVQPGDNQTFKNAWTAAVNLDPVQFFRNEYQFMLDKYWGPTTNKMKEHDLGNINYNRAVQEAAWSSAVQYGPETSANRFKEAGLNFSMDPTTLMKKWYAYKIANVDSHFESSDADVRKNVASRYERELSKLLGLINVKPIDPVNGDNAYPSATSNVTSVDANLTPMTTASQASGATGIGGIISAAIKNIANMTTGVLGNILKNIHADQTSPSTNAETSTATNAAANSGNASFSGTRVSADAKEANNFPYFRQGDPAWGQMMYGPATMSASACGPTSMAMVMRSYGIGVDPVDTAQWAYDNGHRTKSNGTDWEYFGNIGNVNNLKTTTYGHGKKGVDADASMISTTKDYLSRGIPVIASMSPGTFTDGGHFVVISGYKKGVTNANGEVLDDAITVNDPASVDRTSTIYEADFALKQAKKFWAITNASGQGSLGTGLNGLSSNPVANAAQTAAQIGLTFGGSSGIIDFTKEASTRGRYGSSQLSNIETKSGLQSISNKIKSVAGSSGANDIQVELLLQCVAYMKDISNNTKYNKYLKDIIGIITKIVSIMGGKTTTNSNSEQSSGNTVILQNDLNQKTQQEQEIDQDIMLIMDQLLKLSSTA